jgi:hypothetical protein
MAPGINYIKDLSGVPGSYNIKAFLFVNGPGMAFDQPEPVSQSNCRNNASIFQNYLWHYNKILPRSNNNLPG